MGNCHHGHHHHQQNQKVLWLSFLLITLFMFLEFFGGIITNSLALLSDSGHMLSDSVAIGLSLLAIWISKKKSTSYFTFGYKKIETVIAFVNGLALVGISFYIIYESIERMNHPVDIHTKGMFIIAVLGLIINLIVAYILHKGDIKDNLNIKSAYLHVLGDLLGSVAAIFSSIIISLYGWVLIDVLASGIVAVIIMYSGAKVVKESFLLLMDGVPRHLSVQKIKENMKNIKGIKELHHLHLWGLTSEEAMLSCHIVIHKDEIEQEILQNVYEVIQKNHPIHHMTIQIEQEDFECKHHHHD